MEKILRWKFIVVMVKCVSKPKCIDLRNYWYNLTNVIMVNLPYVTFQKIELLDSIDHT